MSAQAGVPSSRVELLRTRRDFLQATGVLLVTRDPPPPPPPAPGQPPAVPANPAEGAEVLLSVWDDGQVIALHGHVDLGTGMRTALAQIVAEELDVPMEKVCMVLGDTARAPNQGPTIASASIQIHALPLRLAAAQARALLVDRAARCSAWLRRRSRCATGSCCRARVRKRCRAAHRSAMRIAARRAHRAAPRRRMRRSSRPTSTASSASRCRASTFRPRWRASSSSCTTCACRACCTAASCGRRMPAPTMATSSATRWSRSTSRRSRTSRASARSSCIRDFVGVVAEREEQAEQAAARSCACTGSPGPACRRSTISQQALRDNPADAAPAGRRGRRRCRAAPARAQPMPRDYVWPYQMHASIGPSCALADWRGDARSRTR